MRERQMVDRPTEVLAPMSPEDCETASGRRGRRRARKMWKRPIRISRLPSFGLSGFDFTFDQIPAIFTGYTAGSEDSSSSEVSDASVSYSQPAGSSDENEEIKQVRSSAVKRRASLKGMKSISRIPSMKLRRQLTRKFSGGIETRQRLKKVRSIKRSRSLLTRKLHSKDDRSSRGWSVEAVGLSQPRYSRPTSSSASKKVVQTQKNPKPNSGSMAKRLFGGCLTRTSSLRPSRKLTKIASMRSSRKKIRGISPLQDSSLRRATCSSALKDSKFVDDVSDKKVCRYAYCSLHGHHHHTDDVNFLSLRRFVSMRRRLLKSQKSIKRSSILLKRPFSRKRGSRIGQVVGGRNTTDQESGQVDFNADGKSNQDSCEVDFSCSENRIYGNDSESNRISFETHDLATADVHENRDGSSDLAFGTNATSQVVSARKRWGDQQTPREESEVTRIDTPKNVKLWRLVYQHMLMGLGHEIGTSGAMKDRETESFNTEGAGSCQDGPEVVQDRNVWEDSQKTEHERSNAVKFVKQAFNEVLSEIPDYTSDDKSTTGDKTSYHECLKGEKVQGLASCNSGTPKIAGDTAVSGIASASNMGEGSNQRVPKNWSYLKEIILLKRFVKSLENLRNFDQGGPRNLSEEPKQEVVEMVRLRDKSVGERKDGREWMLDYALRQVISTLAPSQKLKVELLVRAFETVFPTDNLRTHLKYSGRPEQNDPGCTSSCLMNSGEAERQSMCLETSLRENKDEATDTLVTEDPVQEHERPHFVCCDNGMDLDTSHGRGYTGIGVASGVPAVSGGLILDEPVESVVDGSLCDSLALREGLDGSGSCTEEEKEGNSERGTKAERQNLIKWRNLIYRHMIMGLSAKDESKPHVNKEEHVEDTGQLGSTDRSIKFGCSPGTTQIIGVEEDVGTADSSIHAVNLVQQAFEKILSKIPDLSSDEHTVPAVSNSGKDTTVEEKKDLQRQDGAKGWNSLKKVILLKRFVKSLEKVRNLKPRKPLYLPIEPEMEAETVHLRHRFTEYKKNTEELMLDYTLRQVILTLAPSQRRKVALLVQAFDTVLDGGEQNLPLQEEEIRPDSTTSVSCDHGTPKQFRVNYIVQNNGETRKEDSLPHSLEGTNISKINLKPDKKKDCDLNVEDLRIPDKFLRAQVLQRDLKEEVGHSVVSESSSVPSCTSDIVRQIMMEKEKDAKVWNLIYQHMVRAPKRENMEGKAIALVEKDENHGEGHLKIKTKSSGTVKLVREALEKVLSEIPDHSSDGQSVGSDISADQELFERHCEVSGAAHPEYKARDITIKQKLEPKPEHESNNRGLKGWSNLKKVILLRRFVNDLSSLTKLSPRNPQYLHSESDREAEKIHLRHHSSEGRKSSEEWMLDYALRQVISTLEPSKKRKVALLAQAFETISLQETGGCWSPNSATSPLISRRPSTSSLVQAKNEAFSELGEAKSSKKARDSGSTEASIQIAPPMTEFAKWGSVCNKQDVPIVSFQGQQQGMNGEENPFVHYNETDNSGYCLEDDGDTSTRKSRNLQEGSEETKLNVSTSGGREDNLEKQQCMSLWRLLCKQMELGVTEKERNQPLLEETSKEEENNDDSESENENTDSQKMELYECEAVKLLGEAIDEIPLPGSQENGDLPDDQLDNGNRIPDQKLLTAQEDFKTGQETKAEQMPNKRNGWSSIKRVIILKRFVKALEKVRKFNPKEPQFLPLKPDPEAEKVNLRHQETLNKKSGEEWMLDYALQDVVTKLTLARKRKVQLLVQAFETVIPATGN